MIRETLGSEALSPLGRIRAYIEVHWSLLHQHGCEHGCMYGNFAAEASDPIANRCASAWRRFSRICSAALSIA